MAASQHTLEQTVFAELERLSIPRNGMAAVAFSGGGDSTALLSLILKWVHRGDVFTFIIDHALRDGSHGEAQLAKTRAEALGAKVEILTCNWMQGRPKSAIQEKARNARYRLLAKACDGLEVTNLPLFLGHNFDDQLETVCMRERAGSGWRGLAGMAVCSPLPIAPTRNGIRAIRPLLGVSRGALRAYNRTQGLEWIDDPSNESHAFERVRIRAQLADAPAARSRLACSWQAARKTLTQEKNELAHVLEQTTRVQKWGGLRLSRSFLDIGSGQIATCLRYILPAVSGDPLLVRPEQRRALAKVLRRKDFKGATLGGVRFVPDIASLLCVRDRGALTGRHQKPAVAPLTISARQHRLWDGRYAVCSDKAGIVIALDLCRVHLSKSQKQALLPIPAAGRATLPVLRTEDGQIHLPAGLGLKVDPGFSARALLPMRLEAFLAENCKSFRL